MGAMGGLIGVTPVDYARKQRLADEFRTSELDRYNQAREHLNAISSSGQILDQNTQQLRPLTDEERQQVSAAQQHVEGYIKNLYNPSFNPGTGQVPRNILQRLTDSLHLTSAPDQKPAAQQMQDVQGIRAKYETVAPNEAAARKGTAAGTAAVSALSTELGRAPTDVERTRAAGVAVPFRGTWQIVTGTVDGQPMTLEHNTFSDEYRMPGGGEVSAEVLGKFHRQSLGTWTVMSGTVDGKPLTLEHNGVTGQYRTLNGGEVPPETLAKFLKQAVPTDTVRDSTQTTDLATGATTTHSVARKVVRGVTGAMTPAAPAKTAEPPYVPSGVKPPAAAKATPSSSPAAAASKPSANELLLSHYATDWADKGVPPPPDKRIQAQVRAYMAQNGMSPSSKLEELRKELEARGYAKDYTDTFIGYQAAVDRQATMHQNLANALQGDQQAMLSLVANHIGMTLGAQKGARINQAVWNEAIASLPWLAKIAAKFDSRGYLSGVTLDPAQMQQMVNLADEKVGTLKQHLERVKPEATGGGSSAGSGSNAGDSVRVQIPGHPPGLIPRSRLPEFQKQHPDAKVL